MRAETVVVINEIDADQPGEDLVEFIELYAYDSVSMAAVPNVPLDGYVVVLFNGANGTDSSYSFTLDGTPSGIQSRLGGQDDEWAGFFSDWVARDERRRV